MIQLAEMRQSNSALAVKNSLFSFLSLILRLLGNGIFFIVISRIPSFQVVDYGQITFAVALSSIFILIAQFGMQPLIVREVAANQALLKNYSNTAIALRLALTVFCSLALTYYLSHLNLSEQGITIFYIISAAFFLGSFSADIQAIFQSQESQRLEIIGVLTENVLLIIFAIFAFFLSIDAIGVSLMILVAKTVSLACNYIICGKYIRWIYPQFDLKIIPKLIKESLPFALAGVIATGIVQIDTAMIKVLVKSNVDEAIGIYQAAVRLFLLPMLLPEIVLRVFLPQLSRMHSASGTGLMRDLKRINNALLTTGMLIGITVYSRGGDIILLIYGDKYKNAGEVLALLGFSIILRFGAAYNLYFTIKRQVWFRVGSGMLCLLSVVLLNYLFIPEYHLVGAVYASIASHIIYWMPFLIALYLNENTVLMGWKIELALLWGLLLVVFIAITKQIYILYAMPLYLTIIGLAVFFTSSKEDRNNFLKALKFIRSESMLKRINRSYFFRY